MNWQAKIASDPDTYSEAVLGKPNAEYCAWIVNPFNWGGEIELGILAAHFGVELCVVSMEAFYVLPFSMGDKGRCYLLYTGQHYDPLVGAASEDAPVSAETKMFPVGADIWDPLALDCARVHAAVAAANATRRIVKKIKCGGCGTVVDDPEAFQVTRGDAIRGNRRRGKATIQGCLGKGARRLASVMSAHLSLSAHGG